LEGTLIALAPDGLLKLVAGLAILPDRAGIVAAVLAIVAAVTPVEDHVADVVRVCAPVDLHLGEEAAPVDALDLRDRLVDRAAACEGERRIELPVEIVNRGVDATLGFLGRTVRL